jgi:hypothetical protein
MEVFNKSLDLSGIQNPVFFTEQTLTVPTMRLVEALEWCSREGVTLVNLTYREKPYVSPARGDFNLARPAIIWPSKGKEAYPQMTKEKISKPTLGPVSELQTNLGQSLEQYFLQLSRMFGNFVPGLDEGQRAWLRNPIQFDMSNFYLLAAGKSDPTRSSIVAKYLPGFYQEVGESKTQLLMAEEYLSETSKSLAEENGVVLKNLPDPQFNSSSSPWPKLDIVSGASTRSFVDLSGCHFEQLRAGILGGSDE